MFVTNENSLSTDVNSEWIMLIKAPKILAFIYIPGQINQANILSKHLGYQPVKNTIKALLFHKGNTLE